MEDAVTAILKCTKWQEEDLAGAAPPSCRYRYACVSVYPGDYPASADLAAGALAALSYLAALYLTLAFLHRRRVSRLLSPAGPALLPPVLLLLSNGRRINTSFPLSRMGPALLQLVHVSALAFPAPLHARGTLRHVLLEASSAAGVLQAAMHVDALVLPHYTGLDVLRRSALTGECRTCVCRAEPLVVGGELAAHRGLSWTTACVAGAIAARLVRGTLPRGWDGASRVAAAAVTAAGWAMVARDCMYMIAGCGAAERIGHGAVGLLIVVHVWRRVYEVLCWVETWFWGKKDMEIHVQCLV